MATATSDEAVKVATTLTITIDDPEEEAQYIVEHETGDRCVYVWKAMGGTRELVLAMSPVASRMVANAAKKCADKAEGERQ